MTTWAAVTSPEAVSLKSDWRATRWPFSFLRFCLPNFLFRDIIKIIDYRYKIKNDFPPNLATLAAARFCRVARLANLAAGLPKTSRPIGREILAQSGNGGPIGPFFISAAHLQGAMDQKIPPQGVEPTTHFVFLFTSFNSDPSLAR